MIIGERVVTAIPGEMAKWEGIESGRFSPVGYRTGISWRNGVLARGKIVVWQ